MTQTKKKTNKLATIFIATILAILILLPAAAMFNTTSAYYLLGWDLVDNGKHLDWDGAPNIWMIGTILFKFGKITSPALFAKIAYG